MEKIFAVIKSGVVENIVIAQTAKADWVDVTDITPKPGLFWLYENNVFTPPPEQEQQLMVAPNHITVGALYDRFGNAKWQILASTDPMVQALIKDVSVRKYIDLDRPDLIAGLQLVQQAGFDIDPQAIVTSQILDSERP